MAALHEHTGAIAKTRMLRSGRAAALSQATGNRQIPIARSAAPSPRGFLHWGLSDAGTGDSSIVAMGRHPKLFTSTEVG
jgi:hypothetical protein